MRLSATLKKSSALLVCTLALTVAANAQTGRVMSFSGALIPGFTGTFTMDYPDTAIGNIYSFLWSSPNNGATAPLNVPGVTVFGPSRLDPRNCVSTFSGVLGPQRTVSHSLTVPSGSAFLGYAWDLQTIDSPGFLPIMYMADNELVLEITSGPDDR